MSNGSSDNTEDEEELVPVTIKIPKWWVKPLKKVIKNEDTDRSKLFRSAIRDRVGEVLANKPETSSAS